MDDKNIKDFDRYIEQSMNENFVEPPFGMWNRISAELGHTPVEEVPPVANPMLPKAILVGFVAGALVIGSLITGWIVYNGHSVNSTTSETSVYHYNGKQQNLTKSAEVATENIREEVVVAPPATIEPINISAKTVAVATIKTLNSEKSLRNSITSGDVPVPTQKLPIDKESKVQEPYYFPPVDIDVPATDSHSQIASDNELDNQDLEESKDNDSKKLISSSGEQRIKFRKKRKSSWNYPHIIRTKKNRNHY